VLLMRLPYGREVASTVVYAQPSWFARRGYIVVIQDVRGRGESEGVFTPFFQEAEDGYDTVEWAAQLPKSNGKVGMYGFSYQGYTQLMAASMQPPSLVALAPHMTAFDPFTGWFYRGGLLNISFTLTWANQIMREDAARKETWELYDALEESWKSPQALMSQLPIESASPLMSEGAPAYARQWVSHSHYDGFWKDINLLEKADVLAEYPMFHLVGWYDWFSHGGWEGFSEMRLRQPDRHCLVCGPWIHFPWGQKTGDFTFGPNARPAINELLAEWFGYHLKGVGSPPESRYFLQGSEEWVTLPDFDLVESETRAFYLDSDGNANSRFGDGVLNDRLRYSQSDQYVYDPEVPAPGPGAGLDDSMTWGPCDLARPQENNHFLVYTSEPQTDTLRILGKPACLLCASSTASHTAFVAKLSKVDKNDRAHFLCLGSVKVGPEDKDDEGVFSVWIDFDPTSACLFEGECLRLDVSSSAFPMVAKASNSEIPDHQVARACQYKKAIQFVHHNPDYPSRLIVPLAP
ncbi:MAG: CocE/NonD family hydrolase, partial [Verrucomicrobiae bacterium]|nr:CocE/NonD family hydrolase [Verrucomicrobiae bacterium]